MEYATLNIKNVLQPYRSKLCWAACLQMLENYHSNDGGTELLNVRNEVNALPYSDFMYSISNSLYYERSFAIIKQNILSGRPLVFELEAVPNQFNSRHYIVVYGYMESGNSKYLFINDPLSSFPFGTLAEYNLMVSGSTSRIRQFHYDITKHEFCYSPTEKTKDDNDSLFEIIEHGFATKMELITSVSNYFGFSDLVGKLMSLLGCAFNEIEQASIIDLGSVIQVSYNKIPIFMIEIYFDQKLYYIEKILPAVATRIIDKNVLKNHRRLSLKRLPGFGQYKNVY